MKNYFDFTLTGKRLLPIWIFIYVVVIVPYVIYYSQMIISPKDGNPKTLSSLLVFLIMMIGYLAVFYFIKIAIESVRYKDNNIHFDGRFLTYVGKVLLGFVLSIVTLTIYMAWFIKDLSIFFCNNSSLNSDRFEFLGKGGRLFLILLLTMLLPITILTIFGTKFLYPANHSVVGFLLFEGILMIIMIPYIYFFYKWMINIRYKGYVINWNTNYVDSFIKILIEFFLSIITCGIYLPMAYLRLFKYFSEKTFAESEKTTLQFGFEFDAKKDFLFIWGQILLTIITLGIYYPWAFSKIGKRFITKTYLINSNAA
jgi:uncharacterized membrane protein YjgN (DUF898 family)